MSKKIKCDIYTRVSTTMQVDGYSLECSERKTQEICGISEYGNRK